MNENTSANQDDLQQLSNNLQETLDSLKENNRLKNKKQSLEKELRELNAGCGSSIIVGLIVFFMMKNYFDFILTLIVVSGVSFVVYWIVDDKYKKSHEYIDKKKKIEDRTTQNYNKLNENLVYLNENSMVPENYRNINAVERFIFYIKNKRADSLKEALNIYEE